MNPLSVEALLSEMAADTVIVDARSTEDFKSAFVPGSIHIPGAAKQFTDWSLAVLEKKSPVALIADPGTETETAKKLTAAGYIVKGFLEGGFDTWKNNGQPVDMIIDVEADELMMDIPFDKNLVVIDVRKPIEYAEGHLKDAVNLPISELTDPVKLAVIEDTDNLYLHCGGGTRSVIAASMLKKQGIHNLRNVAGGWKSIKEQPKAKIVKDPGLLN